MRINNRLLTVVASVLIILMAAAVYGDLTEWTTVIVNVIVPQPWGNITYPEGLFELSGIYPKPIMLNNFTVVFENFSANATDVLKCYIRKSDGDFLVLQKPMLSDVSDITENLSYTLSSGDPSGAYETSWRVENCSLEKSGLPYYTNNTTRAIHVKTDLWYFIVSGILKSNDAANAYISWKTGIRSFFGHNDATERDVLFSIYKYSGVHNFEGICNDGIDNDGDGLTDCADPDCLTVFFTSCGHPPQSSFMLRASAQGRALLGSMPPPNQTCAGNICSMTVGGATVQWTQAANPSGRFKIYIERNIPSPEITFITLRNTTSAAYNLTDAGTSIYGSNPLPYKWFAPSDGPPFYTFIASSKPNPSSTQTFSGLLQMFIAVNMSGTAQIEYPMNLDMYIGSPIENKNFSVWVDSAAPLNEQESDSALLHNSSHYITGAQKTADEACNDGVNNDMTNDGVDCADADCSGTAIGRTINGDSISCELSENTCWDNFDNNANGLTDCADPNCNGKVGGWLLPDGSIAKWYASGVLGAKEVMCDVPEGGTYYTPPNASIASSCWDNFDNNANGAVDCYDTNNCWGRAGNSIGICPAFENPSFGWCSDGTDNDFDRYVHASMSAGYGTGIDCDDYDCAGAPNCPSNEARLPDGTLNASQCFDGIDNDLDMWSWNGTAYVQNPSGGKDCNDPDCAWVVNPANASQFCSATEFNLDWWGFYGYSYNLCDDSQDNDVDAGLPGGGADCADAANAFNASDTDCWHRFNGCGPCPSIENYKWDTCANGINDDMDTGTGGYGSGGTDCRDTDCNGELGSLTDAQRCEYGTETNCTDNFDNDWNGQTDCQDSNCNGFSMPGGYVCGSENTPTKCSDNGDNNGNGFIDCVDAACWGVGSCAPALNSGPCTPVVGWSSLVLTPAGDIRADWTSAQYAAKNLTIRLQNVRPISDASLVMVLGQWPTNNISYNVTIDQIVLSGPSASSFSKDWTNGVLTLENSTPISSLDLTVDIFIPFYTPYSTETFPILTQSSHGQGTGTISVTTYENMPPVIERFEVEPMWSPNNVTVRLGESWFVRAIANDTGRGDSGICGCWFQANGSAPVFSSSCTMQYTVSTEGVYNITAWPKDSSDNTGPAVTEMVVLNLLPRQLYINDLNKLWSTQDLGVLKVASAFQTADSHTWNSTCTVYIANDTDVLWQNDFPNIGSGTVANCTADITVSQGVLPRDGVYYVTTSTTDSDGEPVVSQRRIFYMCDDLNSSGPGWSCNRADFDDDGATDGTRTDIWSPNYTQYCDNCPGIWNNQTDTDLDGVGDACDNCPTIYNPGQEPSDRYPGVGEACEIYFGNVTLPTPIFPPSAGGGFAPGAPPTKPPKIVPLPPTPEFFWPATIVRPFCGLLLTVPASGMTVLLEGGMQQSMPLPGAVGMLLFPENNWTAQICDIEPVEPYAYGTLECGWRSIVSYNYFATADQTYFCMRYKDEGRFDSDSIKALEFDNKWVEVSSDLIQGDKDLGTTCVNTTTKPRGMVAIVGKYTGQYLSTPDQAKAAIESADQTVNVLRGIVHIDSIEQLMTIANNALLSCDWDRAVSAANNARWMAITVMAAMVIGTVLVVFTIVYVVMHRMRFRKRPKKKS